MWQKGLGFRSSTPTSISPMMGEALALYRMLVHLGHFELDTSAIFKLYERT